MKMSVCESGMLIKIFNKNTVGDSNNGNGGQPWTTRMAAAVNAHEIVHPATDRHCMIPAESDRNQINKEKSAALMNIL